MSFRDRPKRSAIEGPNDRHPELDLAQRSCRRVGRRQPRLHRDADRRVWPRPLPVGAATRPPRHEFVRSTNAERAMDLAELWERDPALFQAAVDAIDAVDKAAAFDSDQ